MTTNDLIEWLKRERTHCARYKFTSTPLSMERAALAIAALERGEKMRVAMEEIKALGCNAHILPYSKLAYAVVTAKEALAGGAE